MEKDIPTQADGEYMAIGVWGQYIYVYPKENLVIVKTSVDPNYTKPKYDYESIAVFRSIAHHLRSCYTPKVLIDDVFLSQVPRTRGGGPVNGIFVRSFHK
jgi:CubicO group peptidase (beta-lactamase class C family)